MHEVVDWRDHIHSDPEILSGKPVIKGSLRRVLSAGYPNPAFDWREDTISLGVEAR
jgi:hypothetical protein